MFRRFWRRFDIALVPLIVVSPLLAACNGTGTMSNQCRTSPILGGTARAEFLSIDARQEAAVCQVRLAGSDRVVMAVCSGTLIGPRTVLTAAHCLPSSLPLIEIRFASSDGVDLAYMEGSISAINTDLDLGIVTLNGDLPGEIVPVGIAGEAEGGLSAGVSVQIGGFGGSPTSARQFAVSQVVKLELGEFRVSAGGRAAACAGDSGGPAMIRGNDGSITLVGILAGGSASCADSDRYIRLDSAASWLVDNMQDAMPASLPLADCNLLGPEGGCFRKTAVWCEGGMTRAASCSGSGACGFSTEAAGFRCIQIEFDPCQGVDQLGYCEGTRSRRCVDGRVDEKPCDFCGAACVISVRTGAAICNG